MATFDPRRLLMFAVRVLEPHNANRSNRSSISMLVSIWARKENNTLGRTESGRGDS
jgi:hypothetical protein